MKQSTHKAMAGTFALNKGTPIHRWYSYLEGYSSCLVEDILQEIGKDHITAILDPFCGTGTTSLVASKYDIPSFYCETNPFMRYVIEAKVNCVKRLRDTHVGSSQLRLFLEAFQTEDFDFRSNAASWDGFEKYYDEETLLTIKEIKKRVSKIEDVNSRQIAMVILASVLVRASKMIRQGDLRFAKDSEKKDNDRDVLSNFLCKIKEAICDIDSEDCPTFSGTKCLCDDARDIQERNLVDCIITSPPYLNGTNYSRNTKLELKLLDFIKTDADLPLFHSKGIIAGINNISKRNEVGETSKHVIPYIDQLIPVSYDKRIPIMVAGYFRDMERVIERLSVISKDNCIFVMDIGDSQFAGVHIPTHEVLAKICLDYGFELFEDNILRARRSKNGMVLTQRLLKFRFHKPLTAENIYQLNAKQFIDDLPYKVGPYCGRNWGHPWHSLCSYHGKLKPSIAHFLVKSFTNPGDIVLDPLCGVGTIPLEACLQGRIGIGNDLSELAYIVTKAKLEKPPFDLCLSAVNDLECFIASNISSEEIELESRKYVDFGFNGKLPSYFHSDTFKEILCARLFIKKRLSDLTASDAMLFSCLLHILHGNRPYALSRKSHPLTPYAPQGEFLYKNLISHVKDKLHLVYSKGSFENYLSGRAIIGDYSALKNQDIKVDEIICSPPFADSIRFYMQNWMRLWLCGWEPEDYKKAETVFLDQKQRKDFDVYISFFEVCSSLLKPDGKVILHLGRTKTVDMAEELSMRSKPYFVEVFRGCEEVCELEKHGIKDKGATIEHQFLFLQKR